MSRTVHEITMLAVKVNVAVLRDDDGRINGLEAVKADEKRTRLIEAAGRGLAAGRSIEDAVLNAHAFYELWRELAGIQRGKA